MTVEDRIERMGESINDLEEELQFADSQAEADRINRAIDIIRKRMERLAEEYDIELQ